MSLHGNCRHLLDRSASATYKRDPEPELRHTTPLSPSSARRVVDEEPEEEQAELGDFTFEPERVGDNNKEKDPDFTDDGEADA
uniref:Uncharacterized protein n=1 Tax=Arundo donax TaxID=35708 RepID=A0A0A8YMF1_ARUDO